MGELAIHDKQPVQLFNIVLGFEQKKDMTRQNLDANKSKGRHASHHLVPLIPG